MRQTGQVRAADDVVDTQFSVVTAELSDTPVRVTDDEAVRGNLLKRSLDRGLWSPPTVAAVLSQQGGFSVGSCLVQSLSYVDRADQRRERLALPGLLQRRTVQGVALLELRGRLQRRGVQREAQAGALAHADGGRSGQPRRA